MVRCQADDCLHIHVIFLHFFSGAVLRRCGVCFHVVCFHLVAACFSCHHNFRRRDAGPYWNSLSFIAVDSHVLSPCFVHVYSLFHWLLPVFVADSRRIRALSACESTSALDHAFAHALADTLALASAFFFRAASFFCHERFLLLLVVMAGLLNPCASRLCSGYRRAS